MVHRLELAIDSLVKFCIQNHAHDALEIIAIPRAALHEQVAQRLRQMLVEGQIAPGAKLNERELCERAAASRARRCARRSRPLAAEGLVELLPNRGAMAHRSTEADVLNTFELMAGLEGLSGELAAQRITEGELQRDPGDCTSK